MFNWIKKQLGYHVCEEFTQWTEFTLDCVRTPTGDERFSQIIAGTFTGEIRYTKRVQERKCTMCGKIQQRTIS